MTENEARGYIKGKLDCMNECGVFNREDSENTDLCDNCHYCYLQGNFGQQKEAFSMAIKALEKQIPKKPKEYEDKYYACSCGNVLLLKWEKYNTILTQKSKGLPYCLACGQKIDWG